MHTTRRGFLGGSLLGGLGMGLGGLPSGGSAEVGLAEAGLAEAGLAGAGLGARGGKLLVLGGTRFLGPPVVRAALAADWEVTLFNRGKSTPAMFPDLEKLRGDRDTGDLAALKGRKWDAVVDTSGYVPAHVKQSAELLAEAERYIFVSTVSVYGDQSAAVVGEDTACKSIAPEPLAKIRRIRQVGRHYGELKALCEEAAEAAMPGRVASVRAGLIVGPEDSTDRFTYWPVRVARGGEILAPSDGFQEVQFVDVRDLGAWCFRLATMRKDKVGLGPMNAVGFAGRNSMIELLHGCKIVSGSDCSFRWADEEFLLEHKVRPYRDLPLWLPTGRRGHFANELASAADLTFRAIGDTIRDTLEWHATRPADHRWRSGMSVAREARLLAAHKAR